jgi:hypothetical protein
MIETQKKDIFENLKRYPNNHRFTFVYALSLVDTLTYFNVYVNIDNRNL